jgi:hypothetical protein
VTCASCPHLSLFPNPECRKLPPFHITIQTKDGLTIRGQFVPVDPETMWCGEHPQRKQQLT